MSPQHLWKQYYGRYITSGGICNGPKQYRFIAMISKKFHTAYVQEFPEDTETMLNASTVEFATICWEESRFQYNLFASAAFFGSKPVMKYLRSVHCYWNEKTCSYAAKSGRLNVLQWVRDNGCPWDVSTCANAAQNGHLRVLQWARKNGCRWNKWTCTKATESGHLHVLQWARENGCPH